MPKLTIIAGIADYRLKPELHLRSLGDELDGIQQALGPAMKAGICNLKTIAGLTVEKLVAAFYDSSDPVVGFHFAGHANSDLLLLEEHAFREQLAVFLGKQEALKFVFLNGCHSAGHIRILHEEGVPVVLATESAIPDALAKEVAASFYHHLGQGKNLQVAFDYYISVENIKASPKRAAGLEQREGLLEFPWKISYRPGAEAEMQKWNLAIAANQPLFGLPKAPEQFDFPNKPFRYLERFERRHASIFFGRGREIRRLYESITHEQVNPVLLFYGQSGVGKSSLLEAGLMPRLEEQVSIQYIRRSRQNGLVGDLLNAVGVSSPEGLREKWKQKESEEGKPAIIIIDQVEELFTRPSAAFSPQQELDNFLSLLSSVFGSRKNRPSGKVLLSYRKEYHSEMENGLEKFQIPFSDFFIQRLNKTGILEAITGLTKNPALAQQYNLAIESELPNIIADDLLADHRSPIAPVLQILLSKMWELNRQEPGSPSVFTVQLYNKIRQEGILIADFLKEKIGELSEWNPEPVASGLVLDLLMFHTTPRGTAEHRRFEEIKERYLHRLDILEDLLKEIRYHYILVDTKAKSGDLSLVHDTLAPIIREKFESSDTPGQRAYRILKSKLSENILLDEQSLNLLEKGRSGMRVLSSEEQTFLEDSKREIEKLKRQKKKQRFIIIGSLVALLGFVALSFHFFRISETQKTFSEANQAGFLSIAQSENNPTLGYTTAIQAWQKYGKHESIYQGLLSALYKEVFYYQDSFFTTPFYEVIGRHENDIYTVDFSPGGSHILTASTDGTAKLWPIGSGEVIEIGQQPETIYSAFFSPKGDEIIYTAGSKAYLSDINGNLIESFGEHNGTLTCATFSPDGRQVLTAGKNGKAELWALEPLRREHSFQHDTSLVWVAFSHDNQLVATAGHAGIAKIWTKKGQAVFILRGHNTNVNYIEFSPDDRFLLTASKDGRAMLWEMPQGIEEKEKQIFPIQIFNTEFQPDVLFTATFSADGQYVLTASPENDLATLWDLEGNEMTHFTGHSADVNFAAFSPDGRFIATASSDGTARIWSLTSRSVPHFTGHKDWVSSMAVSGTGKWIASGADDGNIVIWDVSGKIIQSFKAHGHIVSGITFSKDGRLLATASDDRTAKLWNWQEGRLLTQVDLFNQGNAVAFLPKENNWITADMESVKIWNQKGNLQYEIVHPGGGLPVNTFQVNLKQQEIAIGWENGDILIWSIRGQKTKAVLSAHHFPIMDISYSPDGSIIYSCSQSISEGLLQWDLESGAFIQMPLLHAADKNQLDITTDGEYILSCADERVAYMRNTLGAAMLSLNHEEIVRCISFSPDGKYIYSSNQNYIMKWGISTREILK